MNWGSWALSSLVATLALSTLMALSQGMGLTRMNLHFMVGTILTANRDRARLYGFLLHLVNGWLVSLLYVFIFETRHYVSCWFGTLLGLAHALFFLTVITSLLPTLHPRMATERHGPNSYRQLEPPGFMALNYGYQTPLWVFVSHAAFGAIIGALYRLQ